MSAGAIVDNLLLISQVTEIRANDRSELLIFLDRLRGHVETGTEKNRRGEQSASE
jgi:hypothetical protein